MENSFFIRSAQNEVILERFHICTWESSNNSALIEFGLEVDAQSLKDQKDISFELYVPWIKKGCKVTDFYDKLKVSENSRFIFNDYVSNTRSFDGGKNNQGVIHEFSGRNKLCLLPIRITENFNSQKIVLEADLTDYKSQTQSDVNLYFRIGIEPPIDTIFIEKKGIGKSTIIYDLKVNEERNIPSFLLDEFRKSSSCQIQTCFCFHIVPNSYNITFFESEHLRNVRTLEFEPFKNYLDDGRLKKDELMVVFLKKSKTNSYSFFSIFSKERIGTSQFAVAILVNILCGFLFVLPSVRNEVPHPEFMDVIFTPPLTFYLAVFLVLSLLFYFFSPPILLVLRRFLIRIESVFYEKK